MPEKRKETKEIKKNEALRLKPPCVDMGNGCNEALYIQTHAPPALGTTRSINIKSCRLAAGACYYHTYCILLAVLTANHHPDFVVFHNFWASPLH